MSANILIVEDEPAIRQMLGFTLAGDGYQFTEAGDVEEAQTAMGTLTPDLILLDWMLPGISGVDFARRLKRDPKTCGIPIIMLTARGSENDKVKGLDTGADDFITKPFSTRELLARVRAVMRRSQTGGEQDDSQRTRSARLEIELDFTHARSPRRQRPKPGFPSLRRYWVPPRQWRKYALFCCRP